MLDQFTRHLADAPLALSYLSADTVAPLPPLRVTLRPPIATFAGAAAPFDRRSVDFCVRSFRLRASAAGAALVSPVAQAPRLVSLHRRTPA